MGQSPKRITAKNVMCLIQFSQNMMQGGWIYKDSFLVFPNVNEAEAKKIKSKLTGGKTLFQYTQIEKK